MKKRFDLRQKVTFNETAKTESGYETNLDIEAFITGIKIRGASQGVSYKYRVSDGMPSSYHDPHHYGWKSQHQLSEVKDG